MTWHLHCTHCNKKIFKTEVDPLPEVGAVLIAQHWQYIDDTQVKVGDRFFCHSCESEFQPMIEKVSQTKMTNHERCSCGAREKSKCCKENGYSTGKMCLKEDNGTGIVKTSTRYLDTGEVVFGDDITISTTLDQPLFNMTSKSWDKENAS